MSTPRTQQHRHWIQIEMTPEGQHTGAIHIDLNMVDKVSFTRDPQPDNPEFVGIVEILYAGQMKPIGLKGDKADWFYRQWCDFVLLNGVMDEAVPGLILTATANILKN